MSRRSRIHAEMYGELVPKTQTREATRRLRQIKAGQLTGPSISDDARYRAHGLTGPGEVRLILTDADAQVR